MIHLASCIFILLITASVLITLRVHKKSEKKEERSAEIHVRRDNMSCNCDEWRRLRSQFAEGDPRRLCVHCCEYLEKDIMRVPQPYMPYLQLIHCMLSQGRGIPCQQPSMAFVLSNNGYLVSLPSGMEYDATVRMGEEEFILDVYTGEWDGPQPPFAGEVASLIKAELRRRHKSASCTPTRLQHQSCGSI